MILRPLIWASRFGASITIIIAGAQFVGRFWRFPANDGVQLLLTAFGVTAALAGMCMITPASLHKRTQAEFHYAGEKFFHSSLLMLQSLLLLSIRGVVETREAASPISTAIIASVLSVLLTLIFCGAAWAWWFGFDTLNDRLWLNWQHRLKMRGVKSKQKSQSGSSSVGRSESPKTPGND